MIYGLSDIGQLREINEDSYFFSLKGTKAVLVVSDGMGGHNAGEVASESVINAFRDFMEENDIFEEPERKTRLAVLKANTEIFKCSIEDTAKSGMGATVVSAVCVGSDVYIGNVGDSRAYLIRGDEIKQITEDHSYVNELIKSGMITEEEARFHPRKNEILKAVGVGGDVFPDIFKLKIKKGDMLLLCTDGLTNMLSDSEVFEILKDNEKYKSLEEKVKALIKGANEKGGNDNITAVVYEK